METLFPNQLVLVTEQADYRYPRFVDEAEFSNIVRERRLNIDYDNFENSVKDDELHEIYSRFWSEHWNYQR